MSFDNSIKEQNNNISSSNKINKSKKEDKLLDQDNEDNQLTNHKSQENYKNANFFSQLLFNWAKYAIKISNSRGLEISDICAVQENQSTKYNSTPLKSFWTNYSKKIKKYPLIFAIFAVFYKMILILIAFDFFNMLLDYLHIYIFRQLILCFSSENFFPKRTSFFISSFKDYISNFKLNVYEAIFGFLILRFFDSFLNHQIDFHNSLLEDKIKNSIIGLIFDKILVGNNLVHNSKEEGEKINLIEIDAEKVCSLYSSLPQVIVSPFRIAISLYLLFKQFGKKFSYVLLILLLVLIFILFLQILYIRNYKKLISLKDGRLKIVTYVFQVLKNIKLNGWDEEFIHRIKIKRDEELDYTKRNYNIQIIKMLLNSNLFLILMLFSLNFYMDKNEDIEISTLSTSIHLVHSMTFPIMSIPSFLNMLFSNLLSFDRLQNFLFTEEHTGDKFTNMEELNQNNTLVKFDNATFGIKGNQLNKRNILNKNKIKDKKKKSSEKRNEEIELQEILINEKEEKINNEENNEQQNEKIKDSINLNIKEKNRDLILIKDITFQVKKGEFIAILGPTGVGKTSFLNAIMKNYHLFSSNSPLIINGELSYCSQQPWIMSDTIKNNIIFFKEYNEEKYNRIISLCQLDYDLELLSYGNDTEINSTSSNISGGQKARISLARCLYKDADLYLIDDPFANIDNKVGNKIFKEAFCEYLKNKARILITNDFENLSYVDTIIYMENGKIIFYGNYKEFSQKFGIKNLAENEDEKNQYNEEEKNVRKFIRKHSSSKEVKNIENENNDLNKKSKENKNKYNFDNNPLRLLEKDKKGKKINWEIYHEYIKLQGGYIILIFLLTIIIASKIINSYRRTFMRTLSKTVTQIERDKKNNKKETNLQKNYSKYLKISFLSIFLNFLVEFIVTRITINSLRKIHENMVYKLVRAPINLFHDIVPIGQILNRLTKDIGPVQGIIRRVNSFIRTVISLITSIGLCYLYNKTTLITSPSVVIICLLITKYYIRAARNLTRLKKVSFAPILTIFSETIRGVDTIRTDHAENNIKDKFYKKIDDHFGVGIFNEGCRRWHRLRTRFCTNLFFGCSLVYMVIYKENFSAKDIAMIIHATEHYIEQLIRGTNFFFNLELTMIGFERCQVIQKIKTENINSKDKDTNVSLIKNNWPKKGKIKFENYNTGYRPDTPIILKNINYEFNSGEKFGIVGRTGSGKSSLVLALARIIEPKSGNITIDDINTEKINLDFLRKHLSIVPQDPFLFEGSLRDNIDPLNKYSDETIIKVLNDFCLFTELNNKEKLEYEIKEYGKNISPGQKQLICFARAAIKNNKIIILDEATSSLDYETEKTIKNNMEKYFTNCTLIMITHHISMLKDFKNIILIDKGEIIQTGSYSELLISKNKIINEDK